MVDFTSFGTSNVNELELEVCSDLRPHPEHSIFKMSANTRPTNLPFGLPSASIRYERVCAHRSLL